MLFMILRWLYVSRLFYLFLIIPSENFSEDLRMLEIDSSLDEDFLEGLTWVSLGGDLLSSNVSLMFSFIVSLISLGKSDLDVGRSHVLNLDVESFFNISTVNESVYDNTNRSRVNVEDLASSAVIELVWHTLMG